MTNSMMKAVAGACAAMVLLLFAALPSRAAGLQVESFTLENGMEVVVIPDQRAPIVTHMVWYRVGSADEPRGYSGIAHFLEHLMFKRTENLEEGEFSRIVAKNGGRHNAFTSFDYTGYYQNVARDRLELMMELEADRMANLILVPQDIETERDVIIEERRLRIDNNPAALLWEQMMATLYHHHTYGTPVIGWLREMQGLDYDSTIAFYEAHYAPANAILIVAGDVSPKEVRKLARKYYGRIDGEEAKPRVRPHEPPARAPRRVELADARVRQPSWQRLYLAPSYHRADPGEAEALAVLSELLGGSPTSRLYRRLVLDAELATEAGSWYSGTAYDTGRFGVYAYPVPEADPAMVRARLEGIEVEVDAVLADVIRNGVGAEELERTKSKLVADAVYARDSISAIAQVFGRALTTGQSVDDVIEWPDRIRAVTAEAVQAAAARVLVARGSVTGLLLPETGEVTE